jgi:hypothetical protein
MMFQVADDFCIFPFKASPQGKLHCRSIRSSFHPKTILEKIDVSAHRKPHVFKKEGLSLSNSAKRTTV